MAACVHCKQRTAHSLLRVHGSVTLHAFLPPSSNLERESSSCAAAPHCTNRKECYLLLCCVYSYYIDVDTIGVSFLQKELQQPPLSVFVL